MNYSTAIFLISDAVRAIHVTYGPDTENTRADRKLFKTFDTEIKKGDFVVVPTDTRHGMTVCQVAEADVDFDIETSAQVKWILGVVNTADADDIKRQEDEAIARIKRAEKRRRTEELREKLLADAEGDLKELPIYSPGGEPAPIAPPEDKS